MKSRKTYDETNDRKTYDEINDEVLNDWINKYQGSSLAKDGIVEPDIWFTDNGEKVMVLLKEGYNDKDKTIIWDIRKWLINNPCGEDNMCPDEEHEGKRCACGKRCHSASRATVYNVAKWTKAILDGSIEDSYSMTPEDKIEYLKKIAWVNIKKAGGNSTSDDKEIIEIAKENSDLLRAQINAIKPTVIICGNTFEALSSVYDNLELEEKLCNNGYVVVSSEENDLKNAIIIATNHPGYIEGQRKTCVDILGNYKSALPLRTN